VECVSNVVSAGAVGPRRTAVDPRRRRPAAVPLTLPPRPERRTPPPPPPSNLLASSCSLKCLVRIVLMCLTSYLPASLLFLLHLLLLHVD
jgi:hypothetical protein